MRDTEALEKIDNSAVARAPEKLSSSEAWRRIEAEFLAAGRASEVLKGLTEATDAIVLDTYHTSIEPLFPRSAALIAVGAYGRSETFPYSGADIIVLLDRYPEFEAGKAALAEFARALWSAGLQLNYTARTVAECLDTREQNMALSVSLLDRRFLTGDSFLFAKLESRLPAVLSKHARDIRQHLASTAQIRHAKYQNTSQHLEPDVKEAPGGLRDLSLIDWLMKLNAEGERPGERLQQAGAVVSSVRCSLHYLAGRDSNVLDFTAQEALARQVLASGRKPIERMEEYFQSARIIYNEARRALDASDRSPGSLLEHFREFRSRPSSAEFTVLRDRLLLRNPAQLETDPDLVLRMLEFVGRHGVPPAPETERRLEAARPMFAAYCAQTRPLWHVLKILLSAPHRATALRALQNTGLLSALFPEWTHIENLFVTAPEHLYTMDEHTLASIECVGRLALTTDPAQRRFSELLGEIEGLPLLLFALLFHEMGRNQGDQARVRAERARTAMVRIQMPDPDQNTVQFLIEHQNDLADTITGRDMDDPATVLGLAGNAGTVERLKLLCVFTYADISAINPDAMTPWRMEQLWRAYSVTHRELTRELETDRIHQVPKDLPGRAEFIEGFPVRYLRAHTPEEIETHLRLFEVSRPTGAAVQLDQIEGAYRLTVVARDRPVLFASFAGAITSFGLDILKAEAFANSRGVVLDTFVFDDPKRMLQLNPPEVERLRDLIQRVALGKTDVQRLMRSTPRPASGKHATPPLVHFDSETCETATLVEIVAEDRPGLLYSLATVFSSSACNIDVVLIDTKGRRAIDVFYVAYGGRKLSADLQARLKEKLLAAC